MSEWIGYGLVISLIVGLTVKVFRKDDTWR